MTDQIERRIREAFRAGPPLPPAPASLRESLERVPDVPIVARRRIPTRSAWGVLGLAAVIAIGGAVALSVGRSAGPIPSMAASFSPTGPIGSGAIAAVAFDIVPDEARSPTADDIATVVEIVRRRLDAAGSADHSVSVSDTGIVVSVPGTVDLDAVRRLVGQTGRVTFVALGERSANAGDIIDEEGNSALFTGAAVASARVGEGELGEPTVELTLEPAAARIFADFTTENVGTWFAIVLDGRVVTAPIIQSAILDGSIRITSGIGDRFDELEMRSLAAILSSGPLPFDLRESGAGGASDPTTVP
jgi:hypothetical protein